MLNCRAAIHDDFQSVCLCLGCRIVISNRKLAPDHLGPRRHQDDLVHDAESDTAGARLTMPVLALWGGRGTVGRLFDVVAAWREKSTAPVSGHALDCGHFLPEEAPDATLAALLDFL